MEKGCAMSQVVTACLSLCRPKFNPRSVLGICGTSVFPSATFHQCSILILHLLPTIYNLRNRQFIHWFIHSIGMCRMRCFLAVLRSFFHFSLLYTFSCHPSPPTILPSSLTSTCHLFLGPPLNLVVSKFIHNTLLGILFSSILCTWPNPHNLFNLTVQGHQWL